MFCYPVIIEQTKDWIDYLQAIASLIVAGCAVSALHTWWKEFVGKKKIEFAAEFVEKAIDMKEFIAYVRNGFSLANEEEDIENELKKENKYIPNGKTSYLTPKYRIKEKEDDIRNFYSLKTKALMYFSEDALKIYSVVSSIIIKIKISSDELYRGSCYSHLKDEKVKQDMEIIWSSYSSDDKIAQEIERAVEELKLNLEPLYQDKTFKWKNLKDCFLER